MQESFYILPGPAACRIALLADLHNRPCPEALTSLRARKPDLICIAGDFVHGFGSESSQRERASLTDRPVIFLSGMTCDA